MKIFITEFHRYVNDIVFVSIILGFDFTRDFFLIFSGFFLRFSDLFNPAKIFRVGLGLKGPDDGIMILKAFDKLR